MCSAGLVSYCCCVIGTPCPFKIWSPGHFVRQSAKKMCNTASNIKASPDLLLLCDSYYYYYYYYYYLWDHLMTAYHMQTDTQPHNHPATPLMPSSPRTCMLNCPGLLSLSFVTMYCVISLCLLFDRNHSHTLHASPTWPHPHGQIHGAQSWLQETGSQVGTSSFHEIWMHLKNWMCDITVMLLQNSC